MLAAVVTVLLFWCAHGARAPFAYWPWPVSLSGSLPSPAPIGQIVRGVCVRPALPPGHDPAGLDTAPAAQKACCPGSSNPYDRSGSPGEGPEGRHGGQLMTTASARAHQRSAAARAMTPAKSSWGAPSDLAVPVRYDIGP